MHITLIRLKLLLLSVQDISSPRLSSVEETKEKIQTNLKFHKLVLTAVHNLIC